jgi:hypothetical protein
MRWQARCRADTERTARTGWVVIRSASHSSFLFEHDLFGKPDSTFADHALGGPKKACDRYVLVNLWPVDAVSAADQPPIQSLVIGCIQKTRKPSERRRQFPAVSQNHDKPIFHKLHVDSRRIVFNGRSGHSTPPEVSSDARSRVALHDLVHEYENHGIPQGRPVAAKTWQHCHHVQCGHAPAPILPGCRKRNDSLEFEGPWALKSRHPFSSDRAIRPNAPALRFRRRRPG